MGYKQGTRVAAPQLKIRPDPDQKSDPIQKRESGVILTSLSGGFADEKVTIY